MTSNNFHNRRDLQQMLENSAYQRDNNEPDIIYVNGTRQTFEQARESFKQSLQSIAFSYKGFWIDKADLITLRNLRDTFQKEIEANNYNTPRFIKNNTLIDPTEFFDIAIDHPKAFGNFSRKAQQHICEKIYTEQGFANNPNYNLKCTIPVTYNEDGSPKDIFEVRYYRLNSNLTFDYSTAYKGWQNQDDMPHDHPCYLFWKKWNIFHLTTLAIDEWQEMHEDLQTIEKEIAKKTIQR